MQNLVIAALALLAELALFGIGGLVFFVLRQRRWEHRRQAGQIQDGKLLAHHLAQMHERLLGQYQARYGGTPDGADEAEDPARTGLRKAIEQLRASAALLADERSSPLHVIQDLLAAQEALFPVLEARVMAPSPAIVESETPQQAVPERPPAEVPAAPPERPLPPPEAMQTTVANTAPGEEPPPAKKVAPPAAGEVTKSEAELQAEIDALLSGQGVEPPKQDEPVAQPAAPPAAKPVDEPFPAAERKMTEAEIEAEMMADLEAMQVAQQNDPSAPKPADADLQAEIDALLGGGGPESRKPAESVKPPVDEPPPAAERKMTEAEIEAEMMADLQAMQVAQQNAHSSSRHTDADLQAEIDALLSGSGA